MKRFPEQLIGWSFYALTTLAMLFPVRDLWSYYRVPEKASLALKKLLPDASPGRAEQIERNGKPLYVFHVRQNRVPHAVRMTSDGSIVGMSYPVRLSELPTDRQQEIRERFGRRHVAEVRVVWEQGKPEYYEVQVDRDGEIEKVALDTESEVKVAFNN